jgi:hypothetical protein
MMNMLIAVAAGCASALMFVSLISGAMISILLSNLAPLPLMVAALGWGPASALVGALVAGAGLGLIFGPALFFAFVITVGLPAFWLGYLALLAKPAAVAPGMNGSSPAPAEALEWYPLGRLLLWIGAFAFLVVAIGVLLMVGSDYESVAKGLRSALARMLSARGAPAPNADTDQVLDVVAQLFPAAATLSVMLMLTLNLWLASRVVLKSGRLRRPWPDLRSIELPQVAMLILAAALALSFAGGLIGMLSQMVSAALLLAYLFVGFAVLHVITQSSTWWLIAAYCAILLLVWTLVLVLMLGLIDGPLGLRRRFANTAKPPTLSS